ncbi:hypothetical protein SDC9_107731 [bioreactor metagenome]|uniref:Uncharacterized protein n=1 Tax=bioreactor metagenome TaxID=1076179 RepID=A0A645B643_9ZZZZ
MRCARKRDPEPVVSGQNIEIAHFRALRQNLNVVARRLDRLYDFARCGRVAPVWVRIASEAKVDQLSGDPFFFDLPLHRLDDPRARLDVYVERFFFPP